MTLSPPSGSELGLAYADSDEEDAETDEDGPSQKARATPPPLPLTSSILRSGNPSRNTTSSDVLFPSLSDRGGTAKSAKSANHHHHHQKSGSGSESSYSSISSSASSISRKNSARIAHALGLAQTASPRIGGPGVRPGQGRDRSVSGASSSGSGRSGSTYSKNVGMATGRMTGAGLGTGALEKAMETLLEDAGGNANANANANGSVADDDDYGMGSDGDNRSARGSSRLSKSKSTGKQRAFPSGSSGTGTGATPASASQPQRSNTMQGGSASPQEAKAVKLPTRSHTSPTYPSDGQWDKDKEKIAPLAAKMEKRKEKERVRKSRVCVRCDTRIEDGRWVQVDGGGVLCERCWKNMYLPKVSQFLYIGLGWVGGSRLFASVRGSGLGT